MSAARAEADAAFDELVRVASRNTGTLGFTLSAVKALPPERAVFVMAAALARADGLRMADGELSVAASKATRAFIREAVEAERAPQRDDADPS